MKPFIKPTLEEVRAYCQERKNGIDPEQFWHYYEARGWKLKGSVRITSWKSCVITWEKFRKENGKPMGRIAENMTAEVRKMLREESEYRMPTADEMKRLRGMK